MRPTVLVIALSFLLVAPAGLALAPVAGESDHPGSGRAERLAVALAGGAEPADIARLAAWTDVPAGFDAAALPDAPPFDSVADALHALARAHGVSLTEADAAWVAELEDALPADVADALTALVAAHLAHADATRRAFADVPLPSPEDPEERVAPDLALLAAARARLADATLDALPHLHTVPALRGHTVCGVFALDLEGVDSTHTCDVRFSVDVGGQDAYRNRAGGGYGSATAGFLLDVAGNDVYDAGRRYYDGVNGGGSDGAGFLLDAAGDDAYAGDIHCGAINGGGEVGAGALIDLAGVDTYGGWMDEYGSINGGGDLGSGFLFDGGGSDTYAGALGLFGGINGAGDLNGRGALVDLAGHDAYAGSLPRGAVNGAGSTITGGGGWFSDTGVGFLFDGAGNDIYDGEITMPWSGAANGGGLFGIGLLFDNGGMDYYVENGNTCRDCSVLPKGLVGAQLDVA